MKPRWLQYLKIRKKSSKPCSVAQHPSRSAAVCYTSCAANCESIVSEAVILNTTYYLLGALVKVKLVRESKASSTAFLYVQFSHYSSWNPAVILRSVDIEKFISPLGLSVYSVLFDNRPTEVKLRRYAVTGYSSKCLPMAESQRDSLPSWWFEVDDEDDIDTNTSLLQELEIDLPQIYRWTIILLSHTLFINEVNSHWGILIIDFCLS